MPSLPPPGSLTICEINRDFITAESHLDDGAKETYGKIIGAVFSPVAFQSDFLAPSLEQESGDKEQQSGDNTVSNGRGGLLAKLHTIFPDSIKELLFTPSNVNCLAEVGLQGVSWHERRHILAFVSGPNQVTVRDYEDSEGKDPCILTSDSQINVKVLEWRPNGGKTLAVACKGGICIWSASYPGNAATVRSGVASFVGALSRGSGIRWTLVDFLRSPKNDQVSALSWSPTGRYPTQLL
ncbi:hypothetical protein GIB67_010469 [Kingdonia uniflora]|uniref:Aladin n=1 Tax=Kingdonia uniflora TaxID=39325 RepID=A0A7J7MAI5_9MAGN|nr:hypothetical protein GIB67_010469 [Kingdonia uniflora]